MDGGNPGWVYCLDITVEPLISTVAAIVVGLFEGRVHTDNIETIMVGTVQTGPKEVMRCCVRLQKNDRKGLRTGCGRGLVNHSPQEQSINQLVVVTFRTLMDLKRWALQDI